MATDGGGPERVAVIDTGTNSTRLLVADVSNGMVDELDRRTRVTRLGEGVDRSGHLEGPAKDRVRQCVSGYAEVIEKLGAERAIIIATSSVRDAANGGQFLAELARSHSSQGRTFSYRILSGNQEAALSFKGSTMETDPSLRVLLFDIGGGSTEVAAGSGGNVEYARSLRLGCVRLSERMLKSDPPAAGELAAAAAYIDALFDSEIDRQAVSVPDLAMGVAGTITALAAIDLGLEVYDRARVHCHRLTRGCVDSWLSKLAAMTVAEKMDCFPTMEPGRADVIVGGALIASRLLRYTGVEEFAVSERDILDGAAVALADGVI